MPKNKVKAKVMCRHCLYHYTIEVAPSDLRDWQQGKLIQDAMPYLTDEARELIKTRTCGRCWDKLTGGDI